MATTSTSPDWNPKRQTTRYAENTADIHRVIAWFYGVIGGLIVIAFITFLRSTDGIGVAAVIGGIFGGITLLHAALGIGARKHSGLAKAGSIIVGVLMLFGFPIGTVVGGMLIYNGIQTWPPRPDPSLVPAVGGDMRDL
jgi:hypothetical protein